jgi:hypothetical protein
MHVHGVPTRLLLQCQLAGGSNASVTCHGDHDHEAVTAMFPSMH